MDSATKYILFLIVLLIFLAAFLDIDLKPTIDRAKDTLTEVKGLGEVLKE